MDHPAYAIVVDTSVARAASVSQKEVALQCWETLETFRECDYRLAMSEPLYTEWLKTEPERPAESWQYYISYYAMTWLTAMATGGRIALQPLPTERALRDEIMATAHTLYPPESHAPDDIDKDIFLIETALAADHRIISLNDVERRRFQRISPHVPTLQSVFWTDPQREDAPVWLREGAPEKEELRLIERPTERKLRQNAV